MKDLTEIQNKILKSFYDLQCDEDEGYFKDDETPVMRYDHLVEELKIDRARLKPEVLELRNMGLIYLGTAVDCDYIPSGSGYMLTDKGAMLVKDLFLKRVE